jgi:hypothetical protein
LEYGLVNWELGLRASGGYIYYYVGYPESKFRWAIGKKTRIYFQTIYIAI